MSLTWTSFEMAGCPMDDPGGDQVWIERTHLDAVRLQDALPGFFVSYKQLRGLPVKESIVIFHGTPRPHDVTQGWVPLVRVRTTGTGAYTSPKLKPPRTGTFVVQYDPDDWYWGAYTSTAKVTVR